MTPFSSHLLILPLCLLLFFHLLQSSTVGGAPAPAPRHPNLIYEACNMTWPGDEQLYGFCVDALSSSPKSHNASLRGLAIISGKLASAGVRSARGYAERLLSGTDGGDPIRDPLERCLGSYTGAIMATRDAVMSIRRSRWDDADSELSTALDEVGKCDDGFEGGGIGEPLAGRNEDVSNLLRISVTINAYYGGWRRL